MAIETYFLDDVEGNRHSYDMQDFSRYNDILLGGNGFSNTDATDNMKYELSSNMNGKIGSGYVVYKGYAMRLTEPEPLAHDIADPDHARIDIVVARFKFDPEEAKFTVDILKGSPGSSPKKPSLTQNSSTYEIAIAEVKVNADESSLKDGNVTDKREGNYLPIDNLQRGVQVNEHGMVSMPNQSFIKTRNKAEQTIPKKSSMSDAVRVDFGDTRYDTQKEIASKASFKAKADGIYHFWIELAFESKNVPVDGRVVIYAFVNGSESFPLGTKYFSDSYDRFMMVSGFDVLEKGDEVEFRITSSGFSDDAITEFTRVRVAKTA